MNKGLIELLKDIQEEEVIFFIRRKSKDNYFKQFYKQELLNLFPKVKIYKTISEYNNADYIINHYAISNLEITEEIYFQCHREINILETIKRCRGLSSIGYAEAEKLILKCYLYFVRFFKKQKIKVIVVGAVDNYVLDVMGRVAKLNGIHILPVTGSFLSPKYNLLSFRGELNKLMEPNEEIKIYIRKKLSLKDKSSPAYKIYTAAFLSALRDYAGLIYIYTFRHLILYRIFGLMAFDYRFALASLGHRSILNLTAPKYFNSLEEITILNKDNLVYIPLHWYPEATTNYWIESGYHSNYYDSLFAVVKDLKEVGYSVVVKEHPHFLFKRDVEVYKVLRSMGVCILDPAINTRKVFECIQKIVVWNGSTGCEAIYANKQVYRVTNSYYDEIGVPQLQELLNKSKYPILDVDRLVNLIASASV